MGQASRLKKQRRKRNAAINGGVVYEDEAMDMMFGKDDIVPLTDELIKQLVTQTKGRLSEKDLLEARDAGVMYNLGRNSLVFP